jgi:hypothetical protein
LWFGGKRYSKAYLSGGRAADIIKRLITGEGSIVMKRGKVFIMAVVFCGIFFGAVLANAQFCEDPMATPPSDATGWYVINFNTDPVHRDPPEGSFDFPVPQSYDPTDFFYWFRGPECVNAGTGAEIWHLHGVFQGHTDPDPDCGHGCLFYAFGSTVPPGDRMGSLSGITMKAEVNYSKYLDFGGDVLTEKDKLKDIYLQIGNWDTGTWSFQDSVLCIPDMNDNYMPLMTPLYAIGMNAENFFGWLHWEMGGNPAFEQGGWLTWGGQFKFSIDKYDMVKNGHVDTAGGLSVKRLGGDKGDPNTFYYFQELNKAKGSVVPLNEIPFDVQEQCGFFELQ